jgi:hypothetical protein
LGNKSTKETEMPSDCMNPRRFLSAEEAAPIFGRSGQWVRARLRSGDIRSVRIGPSKLIPVEEIDRLREEGLKPARETATA